MRDTPFSPTIIEAVTDAWRGDPSLEQECVRVYALTKYREDAGVFREEPLVLLTSGHLVHQPVLALTEALRSAIDVESFITMAWPVNVDGVLYEVSLRLSQILDNQERDAIVFLIRTFLKNKNIVTASPERIFALIDGRTPPPEPIATTEENK